METQKHYFRIELPATENTPARTVINELKAIDLYTALLRGHFVVYEDIDVNRARVEYAFHSVRIFQCLLTITEKEFKLE